MLQGMGMGTALMNMKCDLKLKSTSFWDDSGLCKRRKRREKG